MCPQKHKLFRGSRSQSAIRPYSNGDEDSNFARFQHTADNDIHVFLNVLKPSGNHGPYGQLPLVCVLRALGLGRVGVALGWLEWAWRLDVYWPHVP